MRRRKHTGLLVTLKPLIEENEHDEATNRGKEQDLGYGIVSVTIAYHHSVPCALDQPCTRFWPRGVNQRNVLAVLAHEGLHHTFLRIGQDDAQDALDVIMPSIQHTCRILGCSNHQIGAKGLSLRRSMKLTVVE